MANEIRNWAKTVTLGNATAKAIFLELCDLADDAPGFADRTVPQIAEITELSIAAVKKWLRWLETEKKLIERQTSERESGRFSGKLTRVVYPKSVLEKINGRRERLNKEPVLPGLPDSPGHEETHAAAATSAASPGLPRTEGTRYPPVHSTDKEDLEETKEGVISSHTAQAAGACACEESPPAKISVGGKTGISADEILDEAPETLAEFKITAITGIAQALNPKLKTMPNSHEWTESLEWAFEQGFSSAEAVECYSLMRQQKWRKGRISPKGLIDNLPSLAALRRETEEQETQNGTIQSKQPITQRDQKIINRRVAVEQARAAAERRRIEKLQGSNDADSS